MEDDGFKACPFCKETIRKEAVKCRFCGEWLEQSSQTQPAANHAPAPPKFETLPPVAIDENKSIIQPAVKKEISPKSLYWISAALLTACCLVLFVGFASGHWSRLSPPKQGEAIANIIIGLADTVPPEVLERVRKNHKANMLAVANQFNHESQINWEDTVRRFRLLSLCAEGKNPLLWSHYADSHRGVAFEFDAFFKDEVPFVSAKPIKYGKRVPRAYSRKDFIEDALGLNSLPDAAQALLPLVMTKSLEWRYENEWRIVSMASDEEQNLFTDVPFSPRSLSKIFLGCRISPRSRSAIERLLTEDFKHVEIHQARQSQTKFALEFDRIR